MRGLIKCSWCFLCFRRQISELPWPITAKLCHMIGTCVNFINWLQKIGGSPPEKFGGQKHAKFPSILYNLWLWSQISPELLKISKIGKLFLLHPPKKNFNCENVKFGLKFSVLGSITTGLLRVSSQNFFQSTCREAGVINWVQFLEGLPPKI